MAGGFEIDCLSNILNFFQRNTNMKLFVQTKRMMVDLINIRRSIVSGTMPADVLATMKKQVTDTIDFGNRNLGLDLVVRNERRDPVDVDSMSAVEIYNMVSIVMIEASQLVLPN